MKRSQPSDRMPEPDRVPDEIAYANLPAADTLDDSRAVPIDQACDLLACSSRTLWRAVDAGTLPEPMRVGRKSAWPLSTLLAFRSTAHRRRRRDSVERARDDLGRYIPQVEPVTSATEAMQ